MVGSLRALATLAVTLTACRSNETIARESFARSYSCPAERITVTPRKDLSAVDLAVRPGVPPKEVAADPGRLEVWKKEATKRAADFEDATVVQAQGCDHEVFYVCGDLRVSVGATRHGCMNARYPPAPSP
jgi:hypothetical protein